MTNTRLTDPEILEHRFPVTLEAFGIRKNSGGSGRFRGGDGIVRRLRFNNPMTVSILANHRKIPPFGLQGGECGKTAVNYLEHADGTRVQLGHRGSVEVGPGDVFVIKTPGGGGFGASS